MRLWTFVDFLSNPKVNDVGNKLFNNLANSPAWLFPLQRTYCSQNASMNYNFLDAHWHLQAPARYHLAVSCLTQPVLNTLVCGRQACSVGGDFATSKSSQRTSLPLDNQRVLFQRRTLCWKNTTHAIVCGGFIGGSLAHAKFDGIQTRSNLCDFNFCWDFLVKCSDRWFQFCEWITFQHSDGAFYIVIGIAIYIIVSFYCSNNPVKHSIRELPSNVLPARGHLDQHIWFLNESNFCSKKDIVPHVAHILTDIWNRASMPAQPQKR